MAIIKINSDEESVKFLKNQSSILHTSDTNNITVNAVNVIVDRPKVGDVMCVTRYKDKNNSLLPADKQKVIWIDGLSINPKQLSQKYEPVGICVAVKGNKAMVRYREEKSYKWAAGQRWELTDVGNPINFESRAFEVYLNGNKYKNNFNYSYGFIGTRPSLIEVEADFVKQLNAWFKADSDLKDFYSAELVESDTDLPITGTPTTNSYRIIVNERFNVNNSNSLKSFSMKHTGSNFEPITLNGTGAIGKHIKAVGLYYLNNGFPQSFSGGCCRAKYYDVFSFNGETPKDTLKSIYTESPVNFDAFNGEYCQVLRDNFATYDEYIDSFMVKYQCGKGGVITEFPSGKENTYKLADCTFLDNKTGNQEILYPAANWTASIDINAPGLQAGNWWLPSAAEMVQMMRDITYDTSFWDSKNIDNNTDIVNRVILKLTSVSNSGWTKLGVRSNRFTSSMSSNMSSMYDVYFFRFNTGSLFTSINTTKYKSSLYDAFLVAPITLYEF